LLPAHERASVERYPYGKTVVQGSARYFMVFQYIEGDILRNLLLRNPQPWYQFAGWLTISLADALIKIHQQQKLHLCLCPEIILVRIDRDGTPRPTLLDLGLAAGLNEIAQAWDNRYNLAAYTVPELIEKQGNVGAATDVYGLGLILYEMLAGKPTFAYAQRKDQEIYASVLNGNSTSTGRTDLKNIPQIAKAAVQRSYQSRPQDILTFAAQLQANLPPVPRERKPFRVNWRAVFIILIAMLAISLLLSFALLL